MLSGAEQDEIQAKIDAASGAERDELRKMAVATLEELGRAAEYKLLSNAEIRFGEIHAELLTRLDATELGKGWMYRTKRRIQIIKTYFS